MLRQRRPTHRFEVFVASVHIASPVSSDLSTTPSFTRTLAFAFRLGPRRVVNVVFLISLGVDLQVNAKTLLLGKCLAVAGRIGARWRVHHPHVVLQGRPCWVVCWVRALWRQAGAVDTGVPFVCERVRLGGAYMTRKTDHRASWSAP